MSHTFLALDLSIKSTGFALWSDGWDKPRCGTWELAPSVDWAARAYVRLHRHLLDIHRISPLDAVIYEQALSPFAVKGQTSIETLAAAAGLAAHVQSFGEACGVRHRAVSIAAWRKHWIGSMPRGTKTPDLKAMAMKRCRELGFDALKHDAAEACGLLDYELSVSGITPPWREQLDFAEQFQPRRKAVRG